MTEFEKWFIADKNYLYFETLIKQNHPGLAAELVWDACEEIVRDRILHLVAEHTELSMDKLVDEVFKETSIDGG